MFCTIAQLDRGPRAAAGPTFVTAATGAASSIIFSFVGFGWQYTRKEAGVRKDTSLDVGRWGRSRSSARGG